MGVSSVTNRVTLAGDGVTTTFAFPYYFFRQADLIVYIYDTLLGGMTGPYILNTDYTITGSQNYQGLYASGGTVIFSTYVPLTTDIAVILRSPIEQQNYALLQGGTISSTAIVQQFDYVTLLIQRLTDQVARCIQIPDGMGQAFDGNLPSNVALTPGASPTVNTLGTGWTLNHGSGWTADVLGFAALQVPALVNHFPLITLPAGAMLTGLAVKHSQAFSGAGITDVNVALGVVADYGEFINNFDVFQAVGDQVFDNSEMNFIGSWATPTTIYLSTTAVGANLTALAAGSLTVWSKYEMVT